MMKKILFVINHFRYSNGVAAALYNLISNLDENEYDIHLLALYELDEEFVAPIIHKISIVKGFGFYLRGFDRIVNMIPPKLLYRHFISDKYDVEVSFQYGIPTKMVAYSDNCNKICWMHTYDTEMYLRRYYERYKKIVTVARVGREKLIRDGFREDVTDYCYNIIDEARINQMAQEPLSIKRNSKYVIITVARLNPDKACMRYMQCIKKVVEKYRDVEFWILGDGVERPKMEQFVTNNTLGENVKILGLQKNPYKFMREADMYFCASYREGFSTACQEAAIMGLPVLSVDVDGAEELIELAECGKVIPNTDTAIVDNLISVLNEDLTIETWKRTAMLTRSNFWKEERLKKIKKVLDM